MSNNKNKDDKLVSVVMITYHTGDVLWKSIDSVLEQNLLHELIIVNNGNPKAFERKLKLLVESSTNIKLITGHGNIGFAAACNLGAKEAQSEYLLLLNPDCKLPRKTFSTAIENLDNNPKAWVAGCKLVNEDGSEQRGGRRNLLDFQTLITFGLKLDKWPYFKKFAKPLNLDKTPLPKSTKYVPAISGAFMFMNIGKYWRIGGMDEGYFLHVEDLDFCYQIKKLGGKIIYIPDLEVKHVGATSNVTTLFLERNKANGIIRYFEKNMKDKYPKGTVELVKFLSYAKLWLKMICVKLTYKKAKA
ncbi:glycosyltransferase family 2 protein [Rickettsiales bacterium]|nr:glycosyltransferase family 2 protein [Rickettsiales bacterium]